MLSSKTEEASLVSCCQAIGFTLSHSSLLSKSVFDNISAYWSCDIELSISLDNRVADAKSRHICK